MTGKEAIFRKVRKYYKAFYRETEFIPGVSWVRSSGRVFDAEDLVCLVDAALGEWVTAYRYAGFLEEELREYVGMPYAALCNSGSSANLLALTALTAPELGERALKAGGEVITTAAAFPTTVNPIVQNGLVPVFVDIGLGNYNARPSRIEQAIGPKTKAIILAHTLGNPFSVDFVLHIAKKHNLWLIEDNCDALGSTYRGEKTGSFGDLSTCSFFPAHHITTGEGGCVFSSNETLDKIVRSLRDWGRDCICKTGQDNTCGKRFGQQMGGLPHGYDHRYIYSRIGYNLKMSEIEAAGGAAQLRKLPRFNRLRRRNFDALLYGLSGYEEYFLLPWASPSTDPAWFGFPITVREDAPFDRANLIAHLQEKKIDTRLFFAGNITRQPAYKDVKYRVVGDLPNTDAVMERGFWIGVYPGITEEMIEYVVKVFWDFFNRL